MVCRSLIRAYQRWSTYDVSRSSPVAWLLANVGTESRRDHDDRDGGGMVELVDRADTGPPTRDVALERAVDGLRGRGRAAVDLHYFVGVEVAVVADVLRCSPDTVEHALRQAQDRLGRLVGDSVDDPMHQRLTAAARRWQDEQPPEPEIPVLRLDEPARARFPRRRTLTAVAALVLVGGAVAIVSTLHRDDTTAPTAADPSPTPHVQRAQKVVPFRDLDPSHLTLGHVQDGVLLTPYDDVTATGNIAGTVHPGDTLTFDAVLEAPGLVSFLPCPDYTITFGTVATTRRLNCADVPFFASLVRSTGKVTAFRPVMPAGTRVLFRMQVTVPDEPGPQRVVWMLDGPQVTPQFDGIVEVTPR